MHPATLLLALLATTKALQRLTVLRNRLDRDRMRDDHRDWVQDRRARTRHLIELGGLVHKAGLVDLTEDDRATLLGAFLEMAGYLQGNHPTGVTPDDLRIRWRRRGLWMFDADAEVREVARQEAGLAATSRSGDGDQQAAAILPNP